VKAHQVCVVTTYLVYLRYRGHEVCFEVEAACEDEAREYARDWHPGCRIIRVES
jgi:hypothetical protein